MPFISSQLRYLSMGKSLQLLPKHPRKCLLDGQRLPDCNWFTVIYKSSSNLGFDIVLVPSIFFGFFIIWLRIFKLTVTDTSIFYRTLFGGAKIIDRKSISKYKITIGELKTDADRTKPFVCLNVYIKKQKDPALEINLKVLGHKEIQPFFDILEADIAKIKNRH